MHPPVTLVEDEYTLMLRRSCEQRILEISIEGILGRGNETARNGGRSGIVDRLWPLLVIF